MDHRNSPKFFDINDPSRISPSANGRPVIVGHRPMMADPMMRPVMPVESSEEVPAQAPAPTVHTTKVIEVSSEVRQELANKGPAAAPEVMPPQPMVQPDNLAAPAINTQSSPAVAQTADPNNLSGKAPQTGTPDETAAANNPATPINVPETSHPAVAPQPDLSHMPHVPVSHKPPSAGKMKHLVIWAVVIIILGGFTAFLAIDAGLVSSSVKLPFHIFARQT